MNINNKPQITNIKPKKRQAGFTQTLNLVSGFTLMELITVMTIITIISTAVVIRQNSWNDRLAVNTQAYELALMIRYAQINSLAVKEYTSGTGDKFSKGYGIYTDRNNINQYIYFADNNGNQKYDSGEAIETKTFTRGVTVSQFCGYTSGGAEKCSPDAGNVWSMNITFYRPDPKANIVLLNNGGNMSSSVNPPAIIYLSSLNGKISTIKVENNGQVAITQ